MTINFSINLPILILSIIIALFVLFVLAKPKAFKMGFEILILNLKVLLRNPGLLLFPVVFSLFVGFMIFYFFFSMQLLGSIPANSNNSLLLLLILLMNFILALSILILGSNFIMIVFYRHVLNIISAESKMALVKIIKEEFFCFGKFFKLSLTLFLIRLSLHIAQVMLRYRMRWEILHGGHAWGTYTEAFALGFANQVLAYAPIDYAIYKSSPKEAITKSYEINKNWTAVNIALHIISFLPVIIFVIGGAILLSGGYNLLGSFEMKNLSDLGRAFVTASYVFITILLYAIPSFSLAISSLVIYILYNNAYEEGNLEASENDLGFPSVIRYLDMIGERISGYIDFSSDRQYNFIPLKEEYNNKSLIIK